MSEFKVDGEWDSGAVGQLGRLRVILGGVGVVVMNS